MTYIATFSKISTQKYNKNELCKNNEVEANQRQKQLITILSKEPKPVT